MSDAADTDEAGDGPGDGSAVDLGDAGRLAAAEDQYDPDAVEDRVRAYWDAVDAYERTVEHRADGEPYFFVDGPPYTSGSAHMGHAWNKSLKDCYVRYKRMCGYDVADRPGYDMHGLPIETKVEAELGFENKQDIEEYGVEAFVEACRAFAQDSLEDLTADFQSFGVWLDWADPYRTLDPEYMEAAWWAFQRCHENGLVEQGLRSITQCPRCETAIANNEVEYHEVEDPSIYVTFPLADREGSLVAWTTTPWTVPANTFVAVAPDLEYQAVEATRDGETEVLWIAEPCVEEVLAKGRYDDYQVRETVTGEEMVGWRYEHPLGDRVDHPGGEGAFEVYTADYVEADRTGLVHSAPGHGEVDFERGTELGLEVFCPVGPDGVYDERAGPYAGQFVRDANDDIRADLEAAGHLLADETYVHDYGQCWRCDTDVIQIVTDQWFVTVTDVKEDLLANIEDSEWYPGWARDNRFRDFVEDAPDWNVSRQRYWGIPIPIWTPEGWADSESRSMDDVIVIGTREELAERVDQDVDPEQVDLHKPTVDDLTITEDGTTHTRVPDVFDVWLDSSVATWGTLDFPGAPGSEQAVEELWPADLIVEAHDQTRGWFWSQLGMGTAAVGEVPYETVLMHGHALMPDGRAMSKSRDITIAPREVIDEHGADPMRLFLLSLAARGDDIRVSWEEIAEMQRRLNILWNAVQFPLPYLEMDDLDPAALSLEDEREGLETVDRWLLARLATVVEAATEAMEEFAQDQALDALLEFVVEDCSRYYIQVVRDRMWATSDTDSKRAAYATLTYALERVARLLAPFAPYVAEEVYQGLTGGAGHPTVHMCDWPEPNPEHFDEDLESAVSVLRSIEESANAARQKAERGLRWPVRRVVVRAPNQQVVDAVNNNTELLRDRLNAREIVLVEPGEEWGELKYSAEAELDELGPAFGEKSTEIMNALNQARVEEWSMAALENAVEAETGYDIQLQDRMVTKTEEVPQEVYRMGYLVDADSDEYDQEAGQVYVDATLDDDVESEGYAREVIRRAQELRKDLDLEMDREVRLDVLVYDDRVAELVAEHQDLIKQEVRAAELGEVEDGERRDYEVEGVDVTLVMRPLEQVSQ